jgi:hypothetical protein
LTKTESKWYCLSKGSNKNLDVIPIRQWLCNIINGLPNPQCDTAKILVSLEWYSLWSMTPGGKSCDPHFYDSNTQNGQKQTRLAVVVCWLTRWEDKESKDTRCTIFVKISYWNLWLVSFKGAVCVLPSLIFVCFIWRMIRTSCKYLLLFWFAGVSIMWPAAPKLLWCLWA